MGSKIRQRVQAMGEVEFLAARWNALIAEVNASAGMFNLIGKNWTGQVLQVAS
jgi:hypothetical protein